MMDSLEIIAVCDLKVGRCRQLSELMKVFEYSWSMSLLDHGPNSFRKQRVIFGSH